MLRALSQSVAPDARNGLGGQRVGVVGTTVEDLLHAVTIVNPGGSYPGDRTQSAAAGPAQRSARAHPGAPRRRRPAGDDRDEHGRDRTASRPLRVPIEVHFTQRVAVDVALQTADGLPLGEPVRLSVHSNAYGKVLFFITLSAGAVLVLLAGRRLWHRFRGQPDRADLDRPSRRDGERRPDPLDVALAHEDGPL
ncbi:hypothetical protein MMAD_54510 [Mycolicibacterium madagascariense]|uniref:Uncharacterized protein n=1 Tax=Mycolicibacterium madagascariense TaxID=212765 RepID=A0A7I7XPK1_9MYCO|nr:hypothetical protein MMAD_54510 [Mycolicibacterium madagascariense]